MEGGRRRIRRPQPTLALEGAVEGLDLQHAGLELGRRLQAVLLARGPDHLHQDADVERRQRQQARRSAACLVLACLGQGEPRLLVLLLVRVGLGEDDKGGKGCEARAVA